ncbi:unnamed protein product [Darwinula stevensoni]|uniref:Methionine aminopeptidase n=1 Tax=Darwinula stevensoni TaxID=69355 RepID=A0A7R8X734_9CRUS|nr:unnamed protein product [Darwinula stevensoni]CAG0882132.1 unnamed protein product [Darwinula stevensoni]
MQTDGDNVPPYSKQAIEIIDRIQQREADNAMVISQFKSLLEGLSEEQARQVMNDCHKKCLGHGGDFPQKFAFVYSQFRKQLFHSPQSAPMLQLAVLFKSNSPDDYTALLNQLRLEVVKDTQREPGAKCHLLMMLESLISEGGRLGEDGKKFYEGQGVDKSLLQLSCQVVHEMKNLKSHGSYEIVRPHPRVDKKRSFPSEISLPPYHESGIPPEPSKTPDLKAAWQVEQMRKAGKIARSILKTVGQSIKIGMRADEIDDLVYEMCLANRAYPSPLNYRGFPSSCCTSVNNVACHGIPDSRPLSNGDIITVDVTVYLDGYHGDCAETFLIGEVDEFGRHLVDVARLCRDEAIQHCGPGQPFQVIGHIVETTAEKHGLKVVPVFAGHGIGTYFHGPPDVLHCHNNGEEQMTSGMVFTVEPILSQGGSQVVILEDGWTAMTLDNARTAQFEHTIHITDDGVEILTL